MIKIELEKAMKFVCVMKIKIDSLLSSNIHGFSNFDYWCDFMCL